MKARLFLFNHPALIILHSGYQIKGCENELNKQWERGKHTQAMQICLIIPDVLMTNITEQVTSSSQNEGTH